MSRRTWSGLVALSATVATIALLWGSDVPLGVSGEWDWPRLRADEDGRFDLWLGIGVAIVCGGAFIAFAWAGARRIERCSRRELAGWLAAAVVVGFGWLWIAQAPPPFNTTLAKTVWVPYYPRFSGYFEIARYDLRPIRTILGTWETRVAEGDVLHVGTHPPGLVLFHRSVLWSCFTFPRWTELLLSTQPAAVREALDITSEFRESKGQYPLMPVDRAALWLGSLLIQLAAAATVVPLYLLLRREYTRAVSWMAVCFWPLLPSLAVFLPKCDVLFPLIATTFLYLWLEGCDRRSAVWSVAGGVLFFVGMLSSLAFLPVGLLAMAWSAGNVIVKRRVRVAHAILAPAAWGAAGFLAVVGCLWLVSDLNLPAVWTWNYRNHAAFYGEYSRTWWKWLLVNPLELTLAAGAPVMLLALNAVRRSANRVRSFGWSAALTEPSARISLSCAAVLGVLWISGKNMGEAARLWIIFLPWLLWMGADSLRRLVRRPTEEPQGAGASFKGRSPSGRIGGRGDLSEESSPPAHLPRGEGSSAIDSGQVAVDVSPWLWLLVFQMIVCLATSLRVDGFEIHQGLPPVRVGS